MRAASFACLVACAHPSPRPATPIDPTDAELGLLAIVPAAARTPDSWLPVLDPGAKIAAFLPEPWAGPVYGESRFPPSPILTDARGISLTGTYGDAGTLRQPAPQGREGLAAHRYRASTAALAAHRDQAFSQIEPTLDIESGEFGDPEP